MCMLDALIRDLPEDNYDAIDYLVTSFGEMNYALTKEINPDLLGYYFLLQRTIEESSLGIKIDFGLENYFVATIVSKLRDLIGQIQPRLVSIKVDKLLGMRKAGRLISEDVVNSIQDRVDSLRKTIMVSDCLSEEHKSRLLTQLERLQQELHKKIPNKDLLFSYAVKVCVIVDTLGKSSKQLSDNMVNVLDSARKLIQQIYGVNQDLPELPPGQQTTLSIGSE